VAGDSAVARLASETPSHRPLPNGLTARIELLSMPVNFSTHHWPLHRNPLTPGLQVPTSCIRPIHRFRRLRMTDRARMIWLSGVSDERCKWPNTLSCGLARKGRYDRNTVGRESTTIE
jgi:hypothetical protein